MESSNLSYRNDIFPSEQKILNLVDNSNIEEILALAFKLSREGSSSTKNLLQLARLLYFKIIEDKNDGSIESGCEGFSIISMEYLKKGLEISEKLSDGIISERDLEIGLKLSRGRTHNQIHRMGGRKSRIEDILYCINDKPFTTYWYEQLANLEKKYAKSTVYEALKQLFEKK